MKDSYVINFKTACFIFFFPVLKSTFGVLKIAIYLILHMLYFNEIFTTFPTMWTK